MALGILAMHVLEIMFFVGMAGSVVVLLTVTIGMIFRALRGPEHLA